MFGVPAIVLVSLSVLSDACKQRNLASWLGQYELVDEWVVTGRVQHHPPTIFPCQLPRWRFFHCFCFFPVYVLRSVSLLNDACRQRNLESWPGGNGLVGEWVVSLYFQVRINAGSPNK